MFYCDGGVYAEMSWNAYSNVDKKEVLDIIIADVV